MGLAKLDKVRNAVITTKKKKKKKKEVGPIERKRRPLSDKPDRHGSDGTDTPFDVMKVMSNGE